MSRAQDAIAFTWGPNAPGPASPAFIYRRRVYQWVVTYTPTMPDAQWEQFLEWIKGFGNG